METAETLLRTYGLTAFMGLFGWLVGFFTDIGKEHLKRQMQLREEHAKDVLDQILSPLFDYLKDFYLPICELKSCPLDVGRVVINQKMDKIVGDGYVRTDYTLEVLVPARTTNAVLGEREYWHESESFRRYYTDAFENHHSSLLRRWESFRKSFESTATQCLSRAEKIDKELREKIAMPQAQAGGQQTPTWANYERLALLVYKRQFGIGEESLFFPDRARNVVSVAGASEQVIQSSSLEESWKAINAVEALARNKNDTESLKQSFKSLSSEAGKLIDDFRAVLAKKPSPQRCSLT